MRQISASSQRQSASIRGLATSVALLVRVNLRRYCAVTQRQCNQPASAQPHFQLHLRQVCTANPPLCADVSLLNVALPDLWGTTVCASNIVPLLLSPELCQSLSESLTTLATGLSQSPIFSSQCAPNSLWLNLKGPYYRFVALLAEPSSPIQIMLKPFMPLPYHRSDVGLWQLVILSLNV
jgi:hypothetical protein